MEHPDVLVHTHLLVESKQSVLAGKSLFWRPGLEILHKQVFKHRLHFMFMLYTVILLLEL